jgi:SAM-dependent methyltransferase
MNVSASRDVNLAYQAAESQSGGSYTENKLRRLQLPSLQGKNFLDLGCNSGFYCNYAKKEGANRVVGVDIDERVIALARESYPEIEFYDKGWDVFPSGPFDVVILLSAIHYARSPVAVVKDVFRELRSDGLFVLEGGLMDYQGNWKTDCLVPGWRKVGDRCRHLSLGYLRNHLLSGFRWEVIGPSELRGGDEVPRYVVHARKAAGVETRSLHTVDLLEYASGVALSGDTIVDAQPAATYVRHLARSKEKFSAVLEDILHDPGTRSRFAEDLIFALEPSKGVPVALCPVLNPSTMLTVSEQLRSGGVDAYLLR